MIQPASPYRLITAGQLATSLSTAGSFCSDTAGSPNHNWPPGHLIVYNRLLLFRYSRLPLITDGLHGHLIVYSWLLLISYTITVCLLAISLPTTAPSDGIQLAPADHSRPPGHHIVYSRLLLIRYSWLQLITAGLLAISLPTAGSFRSETAGFS